jgi:hypothetical protein
VGHALRWREWLSKPYQHEFAICAVFREEASFLNEWLTFHAGMARRISTCTTTSRLITSETFWHHG